MSHYAKILFDYLDELETTYVYGHEVYILIGPEGELVLNLYTEYLREHGLLCHDIDLFYLGIPLVLAN